MRTGIIISTLLLAAGVVMLGGYAALAHMGAEVGEAQLMSVPSVVSAGQTFTVSFRARLYDTYVSSYSGTWIFHPYPYGSPGICWSGSSTATLSSSSWTSCTIQVTAPTGYSSDKAMTLTVSGVKGYGIVKSSSAAAILVKATTPPPTTYNLTVSVSPSGGGSVSPGSGTYEAGAVVTITAYPSQGYVFSHWSGAISGSANPTTVTMNANKNITANFSEQARYTLTTNVYPAGAGSVSPSSGEYTAGESATVTAYPADGYVFDRWGGDASGTSVSTTIVMNSNKVAIAYFEPAPVTTYQLSVSVAPADGGYVNPDAGTFEEGTPVTLTATAYQGFEFDHWSGDAAGTNDQIIVAMDADKDITAHFTELPSAAPPDLLLYAGIVLAAFGGVGLAATAKKKRRRK